MYKGGFPAEYGGRLSSVVDIKMHEGNKNEFHASGGAGLITSRLALEGPMLKHKGSYMITGRRTYADLFLKLLPGKWADSTSRNSALYFYDLNLKANYGFSTKDHIYLSGYIGRDNLNTKVESQLVFGKGLGYGVEFYARKKYGKLTGWVSYTLSKTQRQFNAINGGKTYLAKQDRPNNISIVGIYEINPRLNVSATWVFYNGNAVTFPTGRYVVEGNVVPMYTSRIGYRMPDYHRLDLGVTRMIKKTKKIESSWNFSIYNVYARQNAYAINFQADPKDKTKMQAVQLSLFRFVPSITYNFKF